MKQNKIYSLLGLAMRGRNLVSGEFQTEDAVKKGSAMLVIVAEDASASPASHTPTEDLKFRPIAQPSSSFVPYSYTGTS